MKTFDTRVYNISDFDEWHERGQLTLSPDFQRRSVWSTQAKSYLIDTVITGKPMPKLLLTLSSRDKRNVRVVVDGQQRLRAILEYLEDGFPISRAHNKQLAGKRFSELPDDIQANFRKYEIGVDLLFDMPYKDILDIFARMNTYTVKLNPQELLNANYVGFFKQLAYRLGYRYVQYFLDAKIITKSQVTRMVEAQLVSDLLTSMIDEVQSNKNLEAMYRNYEESFDQIDQYESRFDKTMEIVNAVYDPESLSNTNWSRIHLFFSLFLSIYHCLYNATGLNAAHRIKITKQNIVKIRVVLDNISSQYDAYTAKDAPNPPSALAEFIDRSRRGTTDTGSRVYRSEFICKALRKIV